MLHDKANDCRLNNPGDIRNNVLCGHEDYLFLFDGGQNQFDYLVGDRIPTTEAVANFFDNLEQRQRYCESRGIAYLHILFPSKPVVATDKLPSPWRERVRSLFLSRYVATRSEAWPSCLCYPRDLLRELDTERPVFHALDTHLTDYGSLAVARLALQKLGLDYDPAGYFTESASELSGDLARMLGSPVTVAGIRIYPDLPAFLFDNRRALPSNTHNMAVMHNPHAASERRLLIFGDSFIKEALHYLAPCFRDIVYVRSTTFQADLVENIGPDVVISSNAERYLSNVVSDRDSHSLLMALYGVGSYTPSTEFRKALTAQLAWRHHRGVYEQWHKEQRQSGFPMGRLGLCLPNGQIEVIDSVSGRFLSTGNDPYLVFPRTPVVPRRHYLLQFRMHSEVASIATVYYQDGVDSPFSESCTERLPILEGDNKLCFFLSGDQLGRSLRLDPLTRAGHFTITDVVLVESSIN